MVGERLIITCMAFLNWLQKEFMTSRGKFYIILGLTFFPLSLFSQSYPEPIDREKLCMSKEKVRSRTTYHLKNVKDSIDPQWKKTDYDEYDQFGNWSKWRQFGFRDTTVYSERIYEYNNKDQFIRMVSNHEDGTSTIDSAGYNDLDQVNYRKLYNTNGEVYTEVFIEFEINSFGEPSVFINKAAQGNKVNKGVISYDDQKRVIREVVMDTTQTEVSRTDFEYHLNGVLKRITTTLNGNQTYEVNSFDPNGNKTEAIGYNIELTGDIHTKTTYRYDSKGRLIEELTYLQGPKDLRLSRREKTEYESNCLKRKTNIYNVDTITGSEELMGVIKYSYDFY